MTSLSYKRLLVKFSGEAVAGDDEHGIDPKILDQMAQSVKDCKELGAQIGIVIGGGNLFRGEKLSKAGMDRVAGDHMGMLATVMNGIALRDALERAGVTAGTGNPFFTTDSAGCLRAIETQADIMLKATRVDGVYSADPEKDDNAIFYPSLSFDEAIQKNLKVMDATALTLARDHSLPLKVFNLNHPDALKRIACGEEIGTLIS